MREKTDIMVKVLDFSEFAKQRQEEYKKEYDLDVKVNVERTGFIQVGEDKYMLNAEGIINTVPISNENHWDVNVYVEIDNGKVKFEGGEVTPEDTLAVAEEVNLADFVRSFGHRLESNYRGVVNFISNLKVSA